MLQVEQSEQREYYARLVVAIKERPFRTEEAVSSILKDKQVVFETETTLRVLTGMEGYDEIGLADTPFAVRVFDCPASLLYVASFPPQTSIQGADLTNILHWVGGKKAFRTDRVAIMEDWVILREENRDEHQQFLYETHLSRDPHFVEFGRNHFKKFWQAMGATSLSELSDEDDLGLMDLVGSVRSFEEYLEICGLNLSGSQSKRKMKKHERFLKFAVRAGYTQIPLDNIGDIYDYFLDKDGEERVYFFNKSAARSLYLQEQIGFYDQRYDYDSPPFAYFVSPNDDPQIYYQGDRISSTEVGQIPADLYYVQKRDDGLVEVKSGSASMLLNFVPKQGAKYQVPEAIKDSLHLDQEGMSPLIIIEEDKRTLERGYFCGVVPEAWQEEHPDMFYSHQDTLLGQLVVGAYSPKISLPTELPMIFPSRNESGLWRPRWQKMREQQMPDVVRRFAHRYLKWSPVIKGLSQLITFS